jgi:hypothetical protein
MTNSATIFDWRDIVFYYKESMERRLGFVSTRMAPDEPEADNESSGVSLLSRISKIWKLTKTPRVPRSVNGDEWRFWIRIWKLPVFRGAVKPRLVGGDRSHGATFFTLTRNLKLSARGSIVQNNIMLLKLPLHWEGFPVRVEIRR